MMAQRSRSTVKIYDPETGKTANLENLIRRLGILAVARKYNVTESAVHKWREGVHRPSRRTVTRSLKKLF